MVPTISEIVGCIIYYFVLSFLCIPPRIQAFLSHHLRIPDARCPHCDEEIMNAFKKSYYTGKYRWLCFECPHCGKWSRLSYTVLALIIVPIAVIVLLILLQVQAVWIRVLVYFIAVLAIKYLEARMSTLVDCIKPLL